MILTLVSETVQTRPLGLGLVRSLVYAAIGDTFVKWR